MKRRKILLALAGIICGVIMIAHFARLSVATIHVRNQAKQMNEIFRMEEIRR